MSTSPPPTPAPCARPRASTRRAGERTPPSAARARYREAAARLAPVCPARKRSGRVATCSQRGGEDGLPLRGGIAL
eukprot:5244231-Prymnesium_polylepis.1